MDGISPEEGSRMTAARKVTINRLATGVPRLDDVLGGGLPEYSFNLIVGGPGSGKTTLAHQMMFANASADRPSLYFTVLGEPTLKMLRYQQQFRFFDMAKVNREIQLFNLTQEALGRDLSKVLEQIVAKVEELSPKIVIVDSFRTLVRASRDDNSGMHLQEFVQRLAMCLTTWQATTFLIGEYAETETHDNPVFTMADGIIWLTQNVSRNSMLRKIQIVKMRGASPQPGLHTMRISDDGIEIFPRLLKRIEPLPPDGRAKIVSTGVTGLDEMLGGGTAAGNSLLVAGPAGSGKSTLAIEFIAEGIKHGDRGVIAVSEDEATRYLDEANRFGLDFAAMIGRGVLEIVPMRRLDLAIDEALHIIQTAVLRVRPRRVALDSITGLASALAPASKDDMFHALSRLLDVLSGGGITTLMTAEVNDVHGGMPSTPHEISFACDDIVMQRYVDVGGRLTPAMTVIKTRGRAHRRELRAYEIGNAGLILGERLSW